MALISSKLFEKDGKLFFECPGCGMPHGVNIDKTNGRPCWDFNGNTVTPTFNPSINVFWSYGNPPKDRRCHSFVRDGYIQFLNDCTHKLSGKTCEIPIWNREW